MAVSPRHLQLYHFFYKCQILSSIIFMQMPKSYELVGALLIMCAAFFSEASFSKKEKVRKNNE